MHSLLFGFTVPYHDAHLRPAEPRAPGCLLWKMKLIERWRLIKHPVLRQLFPSLDSSHRYLSSGHSTGRGLATWLWSYGGRRGRERQSKAAYCRCWHSFWWWSSMSLNSGIWMRKVSILIVTWQRTSSEVTEVWCRSFSQDAACASCCWLAVVTCECEIAQGCTYGPEML